MRRAPVFRPLESCGTLDTAKKNIALDLPESLVSVCVLDKYNGAMEILRGDQPNAGTHLCAFLNILKSLAFRFPEFLACYENKAVGI